MSDPSGSRPGRVTDETADMHGPFRIDDRFQGPTGSGQGGWTAHRFAEQLGVPVDVSIVAPIPLTTDLSVVDHESGDGWSLVAAPRDGLSATIMTASPRATIDVDTTPISVEQAATARGGFGPLDGRHPVPLCFSCGLRPDSMGVHAAALPGEDRYATDWTVPAWAAGHDGVVDEGTLWAALDCTSAWYVCRSRGERTAFTVRFAAQVIHPLRAGETYALVGWSGTADPDWDGRKRHAAAVAFARDGTCVARSESLWVSVET